MYLLYYNYRRFFGFDAVRHLFYTHDVLLELPLLCGYPVLHVDDEDRERNEHPLLLNDRERDEKQVAEYEKHVLPRVVLGIQPVAHENTERAEYLKPSGECHRFLFFLLCFIPP